MWLPRVMALVLVGLVVETFDSLEPCPYCGGCNDTACVRNATFARVCPSNSWTDGVGTAGVQDCLCFAGYKGNGSFGCLSCVNDEYCPWGRKDSPIPCPTGYRCTRTDARPIPGVWNGSVFDICPGGYLCSANWTVSPEPCGDGFFCPEGSDSPLPCPSKSFCPSNASAPVPCPMGYMCPSQTGRPVPCNQGFFCTESVSHETICPVGFSCAHITGAPVECVAGFVCPQGTAVPELCPVGFFCGDPAQPPMVCDAGAMCPAGSATTVPCPAGFFCARGVGAGTACPESFYCPGNVSSPLVCPYGYVCAPGSSAPVRGTIAPLVCNSSFVPDELGTACIPVVRVTYAALVSVVLPANLTVVTSVVLSTLVGDIANQSGCDGVSCNVVVLSVTSADGVVTYCVNGICPGYNDARRRVLAVGNCQIQFGIVSIVPGQRNLTFTLSYGSEPLVYTYVPDALIQNILLSDAAALIHYLQGDSPPPTVNPAAVPKQAAGGIFGGCATLAVVGCIYLKHKRAGRRLRPAVVPAVVDVRITPDEIEQGHVKLV